MIERPSPNFDERGRVAPDYIVLHYTGMKTAAAALDCLTDKASKVSAHYTIDEDGSIYKHVDEKNRAWHAGQSYWQGITDMNARSIGIELVNPGHEFGYQTFPQSQISALIDLVDQIKEKYQIKAENIIGHSDIAPDRKQDPGELFPWQELAKLGIGIWPDLSDEDIVKGASIDIAKGLADLGYASYMDTKIVIDAFRRHFVPEAFFDKEKDTIGLTRGRLYALLAGHIIISNP